MSVDRNDKAHFVLSTDKEWASVGAISGTDWEADYRVYHKLLATCCTSRRSSKDPQEDLDDDAKDAIADAMRRFEFGTGPASDPEDGAGDIPGGSGVAVPVTVALASVAAARVAEEPPHEPEVEATPNQAPVATRRQCTARNPASAQGASSTSGVGPRTWAKR
ncbi:hypothetical protein B0H17DRAFT_1131001 [Mycena rosella]|uniref:Uncharacterized protein n=1 Tax=Mycena rosella TaxID=1033263 RepID=A0AAD7DPK1_MYCRO|nr:hypothetical protein B0H17DRAFT_1131001 [Mycena rosella]